MVAAKQVHDGSCEVGGVIRVKFKGLGVFTGTVLCAGVLLNYTVTCEGVIQDFRFCGGGGDSDPCFFEAWVTKGVWGHAPQKMFEFFLHPLRLI